MQKRLKNTDLEARCHSVMMRAPRKQGCCLSFTWQLKRVTQFWLVA